MYKDEIQSFITTNNTYFINVILDCLVNYCSIPLMSISFIFVFAPVPLTSQLSPLAHAAALSRRRPIENQAAPIRHRIRPAKKMTEAAA